MSLQVATFLIALASVCSANPVSYDFVVHEALQSIPEGFTRLGPAPSDAVLDLRLSLRHKDLPGLEDALYAVSTPGTDSYGKHLTQDEVTAFVQPPPESLSAVHEWLSSHNLSATPSSVAGDWLQVSITVDKANDMLDADFGMFTHEDTGQQAIRTLSYSVPAALQSHINLFHPTVNFPVRSSMAQSSSVQALASLAADSTPDTCQHQITPQCMLDLYSIPSEPATHLSNNLYVSGYLNAFPNVTDLMVFLGELGINLPSNATLGLQTVDNGTMQSGKSASNGEANLDIQYTVGIARGVPVTFLSVGQSTDSDTAADFLDEANYLLAMVRPPTVLTTSYGMYENEITPTMANALCNAYMQLGARGTSVLYASGDGGVGGVQTGPNCKDKPFLVTFPASCPYVTAVGATQVGKDMEETAASFSSGGFSNYFPMPSYQASAIPPYVQALGSSYQSRYNASGRAIPDVSAVGVNVAVLTGNNWSMFGGTSCSAPTFASVVALLNDRLISTGKSPLGFLNPLLYSEAGVAALRDITSGSNPGCGTNGFPATTGWDPITGLGTPNFTLLESAVLGSNNLTNVTGIPRAPGHITINGGSGQQYIRHSIAAYCLMYLLSLCIFP